MKKKAELIKELEELKKWNSLWKDTIQIQSVFIGIIRRYTFDGMPMEVKKENLKIVFSDELDSKMALLQEKYSKLLPLKIAN